jgi:hypothetical protein
MDSEKLLKALENENNENVFNYTTENIFEINKKILNELLLSRETMIQYLKTLTHYIYVDEINNLKYGSYLKWISLKTPDNLRLTHGAFFCNLKITDTGVYVVCKNYTNRHFQIKMDECLLFQKLTDQEKVILHALDHLSLK